MISQFFILSARGDIIINRDFRSDLVKNTHELFYRHVNLAQGDALPIFNIDGINFAYVKKSGLYIVGTSRFDSSPSLMLEVLQRVQKIIKDFCGVLSEEAIRKNFVMIYELLDEAIDFGYPQLMDSDLIKPYVVNENVGVQSGSSQSDFKIPTAKIGKFTIFSQQTTSSESSNLSVLDQKKENQIFVDVFEKISVLFNSSGYVINSSIGGFLKMKSFLKGNPALTLSLNDNLCIGQNKGLGQAVVLDDCNFHNCVNTGELETNRTLRIHPPDGEFVCMNYRVSSEFNAPFRVLPFIEEVSNYKLELTLKIKADFPKQVMASYLNVVFPVPKLVSKVHNELSKGVTDQKVDVKRIDEDSDVQFVEWQIKKFEGEKEYSLLTKISLQSGANTYSARKEIGPINVTFEIPQYNVSNIAIKSLKIEEKGKKREEPQRWIRYITQSSSYVCRT